MNTTGMKVTLLFIGVINATAIWLGAAIIANAAARPRMTSHSSPSTHQVVTLSNDRFAVVESYAIGVYAVDDKGKVTRLDDVRTSGNKLVPASRYEVK